jgi:ribosomal protein S2
MGWNLGPVDLEDGGATEGAPLNRWHRDMFVRFARPTEQDWAEVDSERAAEAVVRALEIVRAVASTGGTPAVVAEAGQLDELWLFQGIPTIDASTIREGVLVGLPPSEERLARLHEWSSQVGLNAEDYIKAVRADLGRERTPSLRTSRPELIEQPDVIVAIGGKAASSVLLAETKYLGIPLVAAVGPETDPRHFFWVIPGNFSRDPVLSDLIFAIRDNMAQGQSEFVIQLERYGKVRFVAPYELGDVADVEAWLQERIASPQSSVDSDAVIAAWDH